MRAPLVICCMEDGSRPFAVCADMAEAVVTALNSPIPDDQPGWVANPVPFEPAHLEAVLEALLYPDLVALREVERTAQLCDDCGNWLTFTTDPDDGTVTCGCLNCDVEVLMP